MSRIPRPSKSELPVAWQTFLGDCRREHRVTNMTGEGTCGTCGDSGWMEFASGDVTACTRCEWGAMHVHVGRTGWAGWRKAVAENDPKLLEIAPERTYPTEQPPTAAAVSTIKERWKGDPRRWSRKYGSRIIDLPQDHPAREPGYEDPPLPPPGTGVVPQVSDAAHRLSSAPTEAEITANWLDYGYERHDDGFLYRDGQRVLLLPPELALPVLPGSQRRLNDDERARLEQRVRLLAARDARATGSVGDMNEEIGWKRGDERLEAPLP